MSKKRQPGNLVSTSPAGEVGKNYNCCMLELETVLFTCPQSCNWPENGEGRHKNDDLIFVFASSGQVLHIEDIGLPQERISSYKVQRNTTSLRK